MKRNFILSTMLVFSLLNMCTAVLALETVDFQPVRAPSKGPADAQVTIIEIADFM